MRAARQLGSQGLQPAVAVCVIQRNALLHFLHIGSGVKIVALNQRQIQQRGQPLTDGRLAATCDAHDDQVHCAVSPTHGLPCS